MRPAIRSWHQGEDKPKGKNDFKTLAGRAQDQGRRSLADDLDDISDALASLRGQAMRNAETALSGSGASTGPRVQAQPSYVPREVSASVVVATIAQGLRDLLKELRSS